MITLYTGNVTPHANGSLVLLADYKAVLAALKGLLEAGDALVTAVDDVASMLRFGKAHDKALRIIAKATQS